MSSLWEAAATLKREGQLLCGPPGMAVHTEPLALGMGSSTHALPLHLDSRRGHKQPAGLLDRNRQRNASRFLLFLCCQGACKSKLQPPSPGVREQWRAGAERGDHGQCLTHGRPMRSDRDGGSAEFPQNPSCWMSLICLSQLLGSSQSS